VLVVLEQMKQTGGSALFFYIISKLI